MSHKISLKISGALAVSCLLAAIAASPVAAASPNKSGRTVPVAHHFHHLYAYVGSGIAHPAILPRAPEYGFLPYVPPNAIRGPGYTFVPGVGILGESCDLPTSACTNEYRDVQ
jgi:hypothetical protein